VRDAVDQVFDMVGVGKQVVAPGHRDAQRFGQRTRCWLIGVGDRLAVGLVGTLLVHHVAGGHTRQMIARRDFRNAFSTVPTGVRMSINHRTRPARHRHRLVRAERADGRLRRIASLPPQHAPLRAGAAVTADDFTGLPGEVLGRNPERSEHDLPARARRQRPVVPLVRW
jgi:hypothetical protein